jgi:uncharacterized protein
MVRSNSVWIAAAIAPIKLYRVVSSALPPRCRFYPTCSTYALTAISTHGVFRGWWLAVRRVLRCHPWHSGGYDPVPPVSLQSTAASAKSRDFPTPANTSGAVPWIST